MASTEKKEEETLESDASDQEILEEEHADEEETAEVLMTDMTLEDDLDKIRYPEPGPLWLYHIEIYPWNADDINEHFIRLMKLASFTKLTMGKKPICHESEDLECINDKVMERQRKGSLHLYAETIQTAKSILRYSTWKNMISKELTIEITKRKQLGDAERLITARIDMDTYSMNKIRYRQKATGSLNPRSARISNLPSEVPRDFLEVVFARSHVSYGSFTDGSTVKDIELSDTLGELPDFNGSLDLDCLSRSSCRSFVFAHKSVIIMGSQLSIEAKDPETMVIPPESLGTFLESREPIQVTPSERGRGASLLARTGSHGTFSRMHTPASHPPQSARIHPLTSMGRTRGIGVSRGMVNMQQPVSASFARSGPGMPVPMTGRQKMNEKMRRNNPNSMAGLPSSTVHPMVAAPGGYRVSSMNSIGDAFKHEIASLQSELQRSTQAIEAKIERLIHYNDYEETQIYDEGEWDDTSSYEFDTSEGDYYLINQDVPSPSHDMIGYEHSYHQSVEEMSPMVRGAPRRQTSSARARGYLHAPTVHTYGNVRHPLQVRSPRGRGSGVIYQNQGHGSGGYWGFQ